MNRTDSSQSQAGASNICYLCGRKIEPQDKRDRDHVFPRQFIERTQPKSHGFKYAGWLSTHLACNRLFGEARSNSESICNKALKLIWILWDSKELISVSEPKVRILGIEVVRHKEFLESLTPKEMKFFKIEGSPHYPISEHLDPDYWRKRNDAVDPYKEPIEVALTVLTKSAAAYLVKWHGCQPDTYWNIMAIPCFYESENETPDMSTVFGSPIILEEGIRLWVKRWPNDDPVVIYQMNKAVVIFNFRLSPGSTSGQIYCKKWTKHFHFAQHFVFKSNKLKDLVGYEWSKHVIKDAGRPKR